MNWPFDQEPNVAAITTVGVLRDTSPILFVQHLADDESWGPMGNDLRPREASALLLATARVQQLLAAKSPVDDVLLDLGDLYIEFEQLSELQDFYSLQLAREESQSGHPQFYWRDAKGVPVDPTLSVVTAYCRTWLREHGSTRS